MIEQIETVIIGGGPAGLSTSYYLNQHNKEHIILEKHDKIAHPWRNERWDSFTLVTPNWALYRMPGSERNGEPSDGFMQKDKIVKFLEGYVRKNNLPVWYNTNVISVEPNGRLGYIIKTGEKTIKAKNVVVAIGFQRVPRIPQISKRISGDIHQIHSSAYRNPTSLPDGAVLIAGSGQSGTQLAEELYQSGRKVFLCVGKAGRLPRRYRGKDIIQWLDEMGIFDLTPEQLPPGVERFRPIPQLTGKNGGYTINLHKFSKDGITLLGHLKGAENNKTFFAPDLHQSLAIVDQFESEIVKMIDQYIQQMKLDLPEEKLPELKDGYKQALIEELDLESENIKTIIWAGGYDWDYSFVKIPVFDREGFPNQTRGVTNSPGLCFVGLPWMPSERTGFLVGISDGAKNVADYIAQL
ncbi:MAG: NAD(P)-binding domain-containing protein [bacterium]|nr:NAD(P)-binding domain-containing protein [bacterium]